LSLYCDVITPVVLCTANLVIEKGGRSRYMRPRDLQGPRNVDSYLPKAAATTALLFKYLTTTSPSPGLSSLKSVHHHGPPLVSQLSRVYFRFLVMTSANPSRWLDEPLAPRDISVLVAMHRYYSTVGLCILGCRSPK